MFLNKYNDTYRLWQGEFILMNDTVMMGYIFTLSLTNRHQQNHISARVRFLN